MRSLFLFLSRQRHLRRWVENSRLAQRQSSRFVAGKTLDDALVVGRRINSEGIALTLDHLGESVTSLKEAAQARDVYIRTLSAIHENGIRGNVSLKLTQFGIDLSMEQCRANVAQLVERANELSSFVRIDMEASEYTDRTLQLVEDLHTEYGCVGTVIQAYLRRSRADIERLSARGIRVRLCKGAYLEPASVAFPDKADVDQNYVELMKLLLEQGNYPAIATHDEKVIEQTKAYAAKRQIAADRFEFQMLYGIRRDLQRKLVAQGYRLRLYVPFGNAWFPYFMRRLAERPANVFFIARHFFRQ
ncbi:MAG TPA: proline dehydrogenase family protein [Bryobacteraceae bacterium]|nr:proline dehydrogenase family protein [Bryobacteraceae bacterium]